MWCNVLCAVAFDFLWITRHVLGYLLFLMSGIKIIYIDINKNENTKIVIK